MVAANGSRLQLTRPHYCVESRLIFLVKLRVHIHGNTEIGINLLNPQFFYLKVFVTQTAYPKGTTELRLTYRQLSTAHILFHYTLPRQTNQLLDKEI